MPERSPQERVTKPARLLVWDREDSPPAGSRTVLLWRGFADEASLDAISIPKLVEENADALRQRYLAWIYELGETRIRGRRLVDHMELRPGLSYWWMTLFAEKCNYSKSPQIDHAIRLLAFESWATGQTIGALSVATSSAPLAECLASWCAKSGIAFEWQRMPAAVERPSRLQRLYQVLPHPAQAVAWLVWYLARRWPLRGAGLSLWRQATGTTTFVSYLFSLTPEATRDGRFESAYWGPLPESLLRDGRDTNWLHLYIEDALLPSARKAADAIRRFNVTGNGRQRHVTLDTFLQAGIVFRSLRDWIRIGRIAKQCKQALFVSRGTVDLGLLFRNDWHNSFSGKDALANLLYGNLLQSAMQLLPTQSVGVYLQENQAWEFAFIHAWKSAGHGRLIGAAHSTVRFWDLRYFFDARTYVRSDNDSLPIPDQVALNGAAALDAYRSGGYPERDLVEVEALRYSHLSSDGHRRNELPANGLLRVLVFGEYRLRNTQQQLRLLEKAAVFLPTDVVITVKPHPASPVRPENYQGLKLTITMDPISKLLDHCDVAYTSNVTSAAVDAYCAGVPVVSLRDPESLDLSPLRGRDGVWFVSTPEELSSALRAAASTPPSSAGKPDFFTLDAELPRWRRLLGGPGESRA